MLCIDFWWDSGKKTINKISLNNMLQLTEPKRSKCKDTKEGGNYKPADTNSFSHVYWRERICSGQRRGFRLRRWFNRSIEQTANSTRKRNCRLEANGHARRPVYFSRSSNAVKFSNSSLQIMKFDRHILHFTYDSVL